MLEIINPATSKVIRELETDSPATVHQKYIGAKRAQTDWANTSFSSRAGVIKNFRERLVVEKEELAVLLSSEVGKPIAQARNELNGVLGRIDFFLEESEALLRVEEVFSDPDQKLRERISHEPLGVIANISAWNYPYFVGSNVFIPALLTGNAVLYKPSEYATLTGLAIAEMFKRSGLPDGVFTPVIGGGVTGAEVLKLPINGAYFTGSYETGVKIAEATAPRMIRTQLELGGKDAVYVAEDVDVSKTAAAVADGAFYNTGQSCCSVERIYVHSSIYEAFLKEFVKEVKSFKVGNPLDESTYIGPVTREAHLAYLEHQVGDALKKDGLLLAGGKRISGYGFYFEPTVIANANHDMKLMKAETFGPLIGIQKVDSDMQAVSLMNDTEYGLTSSVYTHDENRARSVLTACNTGTVYWNCCDRVSPRLPWTGRNHSGIGSTLSKYGIQAFLQLKAWHLKG